MDGDYEHYTLDGEQIDIGTVTKVKRQWGTTFFIDGYGRNGSYWQGRLVMSELTPEIGTGNYWYVGGGDDFDYFWSKVGNKKTIPRRRVRPSQAVDLTAAGKGSNPNT